MTTIAEQPAQAIDSKKAIKVTIVIAVVLSAILEVLDSTIVNVALPHIKSAFGVTNDQITWVLTSYIVASVVFMPLTGFLAKLIGRRRLILTAIIGFTLFSTLSGLSWSMGSMVVFRLLQGAFGAFLIPLSQSILFDAFPKEKRGQAMAMFGLGVVVAPVLGPTLGAILTEYFSWRMVFYVNLPIAGIALLLLAGELPKDEPEQLNIDWNGLILMGIGVGCLQFVLDQGQSVDWFSSKMIQVAAIIATLGLAAFLIRGVTRKNNIIDLSLFKDVNFAAANAIIAAFAISMFAGIAIIPLFIQSLLGYPVLDAGYMFIPRGLAAGFSMVFTGAVLVNRFDPRMLCGLGLLLTAISNFMMADLNLNASFWQVTYPGIVGGFGIGLVFVPMSVLAFENIAQSRQDEASGLYSVTRQLGSSIGIAAVGVLLSRGTTIEAANLGQHINVFSTTTQSYLAPLGLTPQSLEGAAILSQQVAVQAAMNSYIRVFDVLGWIALAALPLVFIMKSSKK